MRKILRIIPAVLLLVFLITVFMPTTVSAKKQSSAEIEQEIKKMEQEQAELEQALKDLEEQQSSNREGIQQIIVQKNVIDQEVTIINAQIMNINEQIAAYGLLIADKQIELDDAREDLEYLKKKYKERIRAMEEGGTVSYWTVLFEANSFSDLLDRINMIQEIAEADAGKIEVLDKATKDVENAKLALDAEKKVFANTRKELEAKKLVLSQKQEESNVLFAELLARGREYEQLVEESEETLAEMMEEMEAMELELSEAKKREYEEELRRLEEEKKKEEGGTIASGMVANRPTYTKNGIVWAVPVDYTKVTSVFGYRYHPVTGKWKGHTGIDLAGGNIHGKPVYATRSGVVVFAGYDPGGGGNYVSIDHLGEGDAKYKSQYMHLDSFIVKKGDLVQQGQIIGYVGNTGIGTGSHLHFVIRHYEYYEKSPGKYVWGWKHVNPAEYIEFK